MSANVLTLKESINNLLNSREQAEFVDVINDYHQQRNVVVFCHRLCSLFDTPSKLQMVTQIRKVIPKSDIAVFEEMMTSALSSRTLPRKFGGTVKPGKHGGHHTNSKKGGGGGGGGPGSTASLPARMFNTLPSKSARNIVCRPALDRGRPDSRRPELPDWEPGIVSNVKKIYMEQMPGSSNSLGFSIRGGAEHGIGIYVSYVDVDSVAERQGLVPGDQILSVNGLSFKKITHHEAVKLIKAHRRLEVEVRNIGRVPGSFETHQTYTWVNPTGRTVSPPPEVDRTARYKHAGQRKSGLMLLKNSDERKVNLVVHDTKKLGIMIRGGNDFGLGIYVTGVDRGSIVENGGLKIGDQILDVNGMSFLDISHNDAVKVFKSSRHLIVTVKDVGKLPYAKTTYDKTKWIAGENIPGGRSYSRMSGSFGSNGRSGFAGLPDLNASASSVFSRGAGSQLMHHSMLSQRSQWTLLEDQSKQLLNDNERATMSYYLTEYEHSNVSVSSLVLALLELFNTKAKMSLLDDIRGLIVPRDLETFDDMLNHKNAMKIRSRSVDALMTFNDQMSEVSMDTSSINNSQTSAMSASILGADEMEPLRDALAQICEDREIIWQNQTHREESPVARQRTAAPPVPHKSYTTADVHHMQVSTEIHPSYHQQMKIRKLCEDDMRSPSEDSGVDISALETSVSSGSQGPHSGRQNPLRYPSSYHGNQRPHAHHTSSVDNDPVYRSSSNQQPQFRNQQPQLSNQQPQFSNQQPQFSNHRSQSSDHQAYSNNNHQLLLRTSNGISPSNGGVSPGNPRVTLSTDEPVIINDVLREKASNGLAYYHSDAESTTHSVNPERSSHASLLSVQATVHQPPPQPRQQHPQASIQQRQHNPQHHQHQVQEQQHQPPPQRQHQQQLSTQQRQPPLRQQYHQQLSPQQRQPPPRQQHHQHLSPQQRSHQELSPTHGYHHHIETSAPSPPIPPPLPPLPAASLTPEEDALRDFDEMLGTPSPPPQNLSFATLRTHSRTLKSNRGSAEYDRSLPGVEEPEYRHTLDLPPPPQFSGGSRGVSPSRELTSLQVQPLVQNSPDLSSYRGEENHHQDNGQNAHITPSSRDEQSDVEYAVIKPKARPSSTGSGSLQSREEVSSIPVVKLPPGAGYGSLRERIKGKRPAVEGQGNTTTSPTPAFQEPTPQGSYLHRARTPEPIAQSRAVSMDGEVKVVRLQKIRPTLGIAIEGGANTKQPIPRILNIQPSGCASFSSGVKVGQLLLRVNEENLQGLSHKDCARTIATAFKNNSLDYLEFTVLEGPAQLQV